MNTYKILCDIGDEITFIIGCKFQTVELSALDDEDNLNRINRIQFKRAPKSAYIEKILGIIQKYPDISLRFYGDYSENEIDWEELTDIQNLQIDLWHTVSLENIGLLRDLKSLGISKNIAPKFLLQFLNLYKV